MSTPGSAMLASSLQPEMGQHPAAQRAGRCCYHRPERAVARLIVLQPAHARLQVVEVLAAVRQLGAQPLELSSDVDSPLAFGELDQVAGVGHWEGSFASCASRAATRASRVVLRRSAVSLACNA